MWEWFMHHLPTRNRYGKLVSVRSAEQLDQHLRFLCVEEVLQYFADGRLNSVTFMLPWWRRRPYVVFSGRGFSYEWNQTSFGEPHHYAELTFVFDVIGAHRRLDMLRVMLDLCERAREETGRNLYYVYNRGEGCIRKRARGE